MCGSAPINLPGFCAQQPAGRVILLSLLPLPLLCLNCTVEVNCLADRRVAATIGQSF